MPNILNLPAHLLSSPSQDSPRRHKSLISFGFVKAFSVLAFSSPRRSKTAQEAPKTAPRRPKRPPRALQESP